jgi:hypothetical protein
MKSELLKKLADAGEMSNFKPSSTWLEAFEAYKKATGDHHIGMKCGSCYRKVLAWLKS